MRVLVTGGGGFLGKEIVRGLLERGHAVRSFSRGQYPELTGWGAETSQGDIADAEAVLAAARGCDAVIHTAAKAGIWGKARDFHAANVQGTLNVLAACRAHGIRKLVHTSSPSVVYGGHPIEGGDESLPYPARFEAHYPRTKARAERLVLAANGPALATVALRPHLIWGPGDPHLIPRLLSKARAGQLRLIARPGGAPALVDCIHVRNAARAHWLALERLEPGSPIAGRTYFLSQGRPVPVNELIARILEAGGAPVPARRISPSVAYAAGAVLEAAHRTLRLAGEPRMTRFLAKQLSTSHWFDISAARRDLGYEPEVSIEQGLEELRAHFARAADASAGPSGGSPG